MELVSIQLTEIVLPVAIKEQIERVQVARQEAERARYEVERAKQEAEKKLHSLKVLRTRLSLKPMHKPKRIV